MMADEIRFPDDFMAALPPEDEFSPDDCEYIGDMQVCHPPIKVDQGFSETITDEQRRTEATLGIRGVVGIALIVVTVALVVRGGRQ